MSDRGPDRIAPAEGDGTAALHRLVGLGPPGYRRADVARLAGIEHDQSVKWWRAMGFPEVPEDVPAFAEIDVEMVRRLGALTGSGLVDDEVVLRLARLLGASFSRIADAQVAVVEELLATLPGGDPLVPMRDRIAALAARDQSVVELLEDSLVYVWRRHLLAAFGRRLQTEEGSAEAAVGFADLSEFTKVSQRVSADRLGELVDEFERRAFDVVAVHGGRAVKLIGDEVMFVADTLGVAVDIGLDLAEQLRGIPDMPDIHCGIAYGSVVTVGGDVFGPAVNLAARLTTVARRGTIVLPRAATRDLEGRDDVELVRVRRSYALKGIGDTRIVAVRRRRDAR